MDYRIILIDMPAGTNGCIVKKDDYATICINARLTIEEQRDTALHELRHLKLGHLDDHDTPVREKEKEASDRWHDQTLAKSGLDGV